MQVLLTGATGFVGSFTVPVLVAAGHRVVALVRSPDKATETLRRRGVDPAAVEVRVGDICDRASIEAAAAGCDAAIHAAAAIGVTGGAAVPVLEQNVVGTTNVLGAALAAGCDPVVHVSSVAVFLPPDGPVITTESRLGSPRNEYARSKVEAEQVARALQAAGAPVVVVYPGGVLGPDQPSLDATLEGIAAARRLGWPMTSGGVALVDVRDLAEVLVRSLVPGLGPRRLLVGGHFCTWPELGELVDGILGVRARRLPLPAPVLHGVGTVLDAVRRVRPLPYPLTRDAAEIMVSMVPTDDGPSLAAVGVQLRPVEATLTDALRWLAEAGHLSPKHAGRLAP